MSSNFRYLLTLAYIFRAEKERDNEAMIFEGCK